ncbi:unnamed protein product [Cylicostephanus goldi]|uniref:Uncharacterized protein n=1 Tax=Cylicostephanus goldi TaxID=71465 RepID=A0A3P7MCD9_CYLGO|nr:unnamed protein product [Cylicostephanus goldi]
MLNSRLKNRIAYGGLGTIDLFKRSWKDLSDYIYLEVPMLRREKKASCTPNLMRRNTRNYHKDSQAMSTSLMIQLPVVVVGRHDYDTYKDAIERLKDTGTCV